MKRIIVAISFVVLLATALPIYIFLIHPKMVRADWYDDSYGWRQTITFTHDTDITTEQRITVQFRTDSLVSAGKMQSNCNDTRFTDANGKLLRHQYLANCNTTSNTTYDVIFPTVVNGQNFGYVYYGNPSAFSVSDMSISSIVSLSPSGGTPTVATEEKGPGPIAYWRFDEGQGTVANNNSNPSLYQAREAGPGGYVTFEQYFQFHSFPVAPTTTSFTPGDNSTGLVLWDSSKFTNATVYLEAALRASSGTIEASLFTAAGVQVTSSVMSTSNTTTTSVRSGPVALTDGTAYNVRYRCNPCGGTYYGQLARLVVVQSGPNITATQSTVSMTMWMNSAPGASYSTTSHKIYLYTANAYSPSPTVYFEGTFRDVTAGQTAYIQLFEAGATCTTAVSGSELSVTGTTYTRQRSANITLNSGTAYKVCTKTTGGSAIQLVDSRIIFEQSGSISSFETFTNNFHTNSSGSSTSFVDGNSPFSFYPSNWSGGSYTYYHEGNFRNSTSGNTTEVRMYGDTSLGAVSASLLSATGNTYVRVRSDSLNSVLPTTFEQFDVQYRTTPAGGYVIGASHMVVDATNIGGTNTYWRDSSYCLSESCLYYDGSAAYLNVIDTVPNIQTIELWVRPNVATTAVMTINESASIWVNSDTLNATGYTDPTYYVNGAPSRTIVPNVWQHIAITTDTPLSGSNFLIGRNGSTYFQGYIDEVKVFNYVRSADQIKADFNARGASKGVSARFGDPEQQNYLSNNLLAYWKLDDYFSTEALDSSGNANTGTLTNSPTWGSGRFGQSVVLSDATTSAYITGGNTSLDNLAQFTYTAWIKLSSLTEGRIFTKFGQKTLRVENPTGSDIRLRAGVNFAGTDMEILLTSASNLAVDTWYHVAFTWDGTSSHSANNLYINGIPQTHHANSTDGTLTVTSDTGAFFIGNNSVATDQFEGTIDDVRVYNRALTSDEIQRLYSWTPNPVGWWKMDENTGGTSFDTSGSGNDLTLTNSPVWTVGKYGSALDFTGLSDIAESATDTNLYPLDNVTVEAWVKFHALANELGDKQMIFVQDYTSDPNDPFYLVQEYYVTSGEERIYFYWRDSGGTLYSARTTASTLTIQKDVWYHLAGIRNGSTIAVYVNGQNLTGGTTSPDAADTVYLSATREINIGATSASEDESNAAIDDLKVYNYARTQAQIVEDMNADHPAPGSPIGSYAGNWKFDEATGTTAYDSSVNAKNLTVNASDWTLDGKYNGAYIAGREARDASVSNATQNETYDFSATEGFTLSAWAKSTSVSVPGSIEAIVAKADGTAGYSMYFNTSGQVCFGIDDDAVSFPDISTCSTGDFYDSSWHHLLGVRDTTTDKLNVYVDGIMRSSVTDNTTGSLDNSGSLRIGQRTGADDGDEFQGLIDEVKIYRLALTADQAKLEYNRSSNVVMGALSTLSDGLTATNSAEASFCVPGDSSFCRGPIAYWKLDEVSYNGTSNEVKDVSGNNIMGNAVNGTQTITGKFGNASYFDGADNTILFNTVTILDNLPALTYEAWIKPVTSGESSGGRIVGKETGSLLRMNGSSGFAFVVDYATDMLYPINSSYGTLNSWQHVAVTWDGTQATSGVKFFVNGRVVTPDAVTEPLGARTNDSGSNFRMGSNTAADRSFNGLIDNVLVYNYARTPAQVAWSFNRGGPQGWFRLDENTGTTAYDSSGNGYNSQTFVGNTSYTTGKFNTALSFDGTNDNVRITEGTGIDPGTTTDNYSVSAWFKTSTDYTTNPGAIVAKDDGSGVYPFSLQVNTSEQPCIVMDDGTARTLCGTSTVNDGNWYLITGVRDVSSDSVSLYINGVRVNYQTDPTTATMVNSDNVSIGNSGASTYLTNDFNGQIDDVKIFRYNLNPTQVRTLFNEGSAVRFGPNTGSP